MADRATAHSTMRTAIRIVLLLVAFLAPVNFPFSIPQVSMGKAFGWSSRSPADGAHDRQVVTRTLRIARAAGLLPGDVLLAIDGATADSATVSAARLNATTGDTLQLLVRRDSTQHLIRVPVSAGSVSYASFRDYVVILALFCWLTAMSVLIWHGSQLPALLLAASLLLLPPSFFPSGIPGESALASTSRTLWQLQGVAHKTLFPALLLHFLTCQSRTSAWLRAPVLWAGVYGVLLLVLGAATGWFGDPMAASLRGPGQLLRDMAAIVMAGALTAGAASAYADRARLAPTVRGLVFAIALVAITGLLQLISVQLAPFWIGTEVISELDSLALILLPVMIGLHVFAPPEDQSARAARRWLSVAAELLVTVLFSVLLSATVAVVLHLTGRRLGGVELLIFAAIMMATLAFSPVLKQVRDVIDRRLLSHWLRREAAASEFVERIAGELELTRIAARVAADLPRILQVTSVELVLARDVAESWSAHGEPNLPLLSRQQLREEVAAVHPAPTPLMQPVYAPDGTLAAALRVRCEPDGRGDAYAERGLYRVIAHGVAAALANAESYLKLRHAQRELAESERIASLGVLAGGLAHEIKNPLASLQMGIYVLERDGGDAARFQRIRHDIQRLDDLVSGLLRHAREGPAVATERVDVKAIARRCVAELRPSAYDRNATIVEQYADGPAMSIATPNQLRIVISNLLVNAIESMPDGGQIRMALVLSSSSVELTVNDEGPGIPDELRERIFQIDFSTKPGGTGIGLALARREVERLGGRIEVECGGETGTALRVTLPRSLTVSL